MEEKRLNNRNETLDDHRTMMKMKSVVDTTINDGQYSFTDGSPRTLLYYLRLPFETLMDAIRIQSDPDLNLLKIFIEQQERRSSIDDEEEEEQNERLIVRSTSRLCRLPKDHQYDYTRLRVQFLKENFIRIEIPTLD